MNNTVKRLIIGDDLFGEIGEFKKFAKINRHQNNNIAVLRYSRVGNHQINYLPNCHIWKTAKYNSRQTFSFYSILRTSPFFQYYRQIKSSPNCDIFKTAK